LRESNSTLYCSQGKKRNKVVGMRRREEPQIYKGKWKRPKKARSQSKKEKTPLLGNEIKKVKYFDRGKEEAHKTLFSEPQWTNVEGGGKKRNGGTKVKTCERKLRKVFRWALSE